MYLPSLATNSRNSTAWALVYGICPWGVGVAQLRMPQWVTSMCVLLLLVCVIVVFWVENAWRCAMFDVERTGQADFRPRLALYAV